MIGSASRDGLVVLFVALGAEAWLEHGSIALAARDAAGDLAVYVVLAMIGALWRSAWNARDGKMPRSGVILRSLVISCGVGLVGGLLLIDLDWSPFLKMAVITLVSFGADWAIPATQSAMRGWLTRLVSPPPAAVTPPPPRRRPTDEPSEGG